MFRPPPAATSGLMGSENGERFFFGSFDMAPKLYERPSYSWGVMKKFAAITLMLMAISCRSSLREQKDSAPTFESQHEEGVASLRTATTMADLVLIESDLRELREIMSAEVTVQNQIETIQIMRGQAILAAQTREDELRAARLAELDECLRRIAKIETLGPKGADVDRVIQSIRTCMSCAEDHQTEDLLLKTEADAERVRKAASAAIARLCPVEG